MSKSDEILPTRSLSEIASELNLSRQTTSKILANPKITGLHKISARKFAINWKEFYKSLDKINKEKKYR